MKIKVCGMREQSNIEALCRLQPDYMGLIFFPPSKRYVGDDFDENIVKNLPKEVKKVGVFVDSDFYTIMSKAVKYDLQLIQLHGNESPELCSRIKSKGFEVAKVFSVGEEFDFSILNNYEAICDYYLFDTQCKEYGGSGKKFDWSLLKDYNNQKPIILSGGIGIEDAEAINQIEGLNIHAIDINSKFEIAPALKDITLLKAFFDKIR